jgi:NAD(P)-dependent dehydrogenase (short-subunit alcohol dehydrogenase family)
MASEFTDAELSRPKIGGVLVTSVEGAVALVTGGRRGLGRAYVDALVRHGAVKVYATARKSASSEDSRVVAETLEVTDRESVRSLAERTGDVGIVVNNAGVLIPGPLLKSATKDVRATFSTNVLGALQVAQTYAPILARNGGGALVNMLSVFSWAAGAGAYGASKAALWSMTNSLRLELAGQRTHVLGVHAGFIDTEMVTAIRKPKISPELVAEKVLQALMAGDDEVLVDQLTEQAKAALCGPVDGLAIDRMPG